MNKIFTKGEEEALDKRLDGDKKDSNGTYAGRVKPKLKELFEIWFPRKKELSKLMEDFPNK